MQNDSRVSPILVGTGLGCGMTRTLNEIVSELADSVRRSGALEGESVRPPRADVLRTRYLRLPGYVKAAMAPLVSMLPMKLRYGTAYQSLREELRLSSACPDLAKTAQLKALRKLVEVAQRRSPFYLRRFLKAFGGPVDVASFGLADLERLPVLEREEVGAEPEDLLVVARREADLRHTSGSSGRQPLRIYLDRDRSVREMAFLHHIWSQVGYQLGDGRAILRRQHSDGHAEMAL